MINALIALLLAAVAIGSGVMLAFGGPGLAGLAGTLLGGVLVFATTLAAERLRQGHEDAIVSRLSAELPTFGSYRQRITKAGAGHVRFHDLRHAHATLLLRQGVHPKIVSERLGHASIAITLDTYSHVVPGSGSGRRAAGRVLLATRTRRVKPR